VTKTLAALLVCLACGCAAPRRAAVTKHIMPKHVIREYSGRRDGLVREEIVSGEKFIDKEGGGGIFLLTDPAVQGLVATHTNQPALGGSSMFMTGTAAITVDPQTTAIIGAVGTAAGNIIGAAAKTAVGKP
jgi:hypothetical protein